MNTRPNLSVQANGKCAVKIYGVEIMASVEETMTDTMDY